MKSRDLRHERRLRFLVKRLATELELREEGEVTSHEWAELASELRSMSRTADQAALEEARHRPRPLVASFRQVEQLLLDQAMEEAREALVVAARRGTLAADLADGEEPAANEDGSVPY